MQVVRVHLNMYMQLTLNITTCISIGERERERSSQRTHVLFLVRFKLTRFRVARGTPPPLS